MQNNGLLIHREKSPRLYSGEGSKGAGMTGLPQVFTAVFLMVLTMRQRSVSAICSEDFSPCECTNYTDIYSITCDGVRVSEIKQIFQRSEHSDFGSLGITFSTLDSNVNVPSDLLAGKTFNGALRLSCTAADHLLRIDTISFGYTNDFTLVSITGCNLKQQPDFAFMSNFTVLRQLSMYQVTGFNSFRGIPSQSNLFQISINYCTDFDSLDTEKVELPGLRELLLHDNDMSDFSAERAVSALGSLTYGSLFELRLYGNRLTGIPPSVHLITSLHNIMMEKNQIRTVRNGTLSFPVTSRVTYLNLALNYIEKVEAGAFTAGISSLYLQGNSLNKFESDAFKPLLQSFESAGNGTIHLYGNPFACDCHLEWLIKDNRQYLQYLDGATCSNSTSFNNLNPDGYGLCNEFTCPQADGSYPAPTPCSDYFYSCSNGVPHVVNCPSGLVFNEAIHTCDWPYNVPGC